MFLLIGVGFACIRCHIMSEDGARQLSSFLIMVVNPFAIFFSFLRPFSSTLLSKFAWGFFLSIVIHLIYISAATLAFKQDGERTFVMYRMSTVFSNSAFMAIPLLNAVLGGEGVFIGSAYIAVMNAFLWTYGIYLITGDKKTISLKKAFLNPATIAVAAGLAVFCLPFDLKGVLHAAAQYIAGLNTPLAMVVMGMFLSQADIPHALRQRASYHVSLLRLAVVPVVLTLAFSLLPLDRTVQTALLLSASCPTAISVMLFSARFGGDCAGSSGLIAKTTLFSIVSMPLVVAFSEFIWG
jgi:predicted permease